MQSKIRILFSVGLVFASLGAHTARALPLMDRPVPTGAEPVKVFPDDRTPGIYWYVPLSIDPWSRDSRYRSSLYETDDVLSFVFRGQASVDEGILRRVAAGVGTSIDQMVPISYESSRDLICQNFFADDPRVTWIMPKAIGNYLEIVPISLRATGRELVQEIGSQIRSGGLNCAVGVAFKGVSTAYRVEMHADLNRVYDRLETLYGGKFLWWQSEIRALVESLHREGTITIQTLEDATLPPTELARKVQASMEKVTQVIIEQMFVPELKLPNEPMAGRGRAFGMNADYRRSAEKARFSAILQADQVQLRESQLAIRMGLE